MHRDPAQSRLGSPLSAYTVRDVNQDKPVRKRGLSLPGTERDNPAPSRIPLVEVQRLTPRRTACR